MTNEIQPLRLLAVGSTPYLPQLEDYVFPEFLSSDGHLKWGRLICNWHKINKERIDTHTYAACIDGSSREIYTDCSPQKILVKFTLHLFIRPIFTLIKTIYFLSLYPIFVEIAHCFQSKESREEKIRRIFKPVAEIFLTPLYGLILTICTVAIIVTSLFSEEWIYDGRKLLGQIELMSNWGIPRTLWTLAPCFQPFPFETLENHGSTIHKNTFYENPTPLNHQLANFARAFIRYQMNNTDILTCSKFPHDQIYRSPGR